MQPTIPKSDRLLGTLTLGILAGSKRYAHISGVRGVAVAAAKALGLRGMVSEDRCAGPWRQCCLRPTRRGCAAR